MDRIDRRILFRGFTLIELLIVVAIIAILAAIAVPNFLEAQTRSKVSRAKADMRSISTAVESYHVDNNRYAPDRIYYQFQSPPQSPDRALQRLTSPIAYITSVPTNPFLNNTDDRNKPAQYRYYSKEWRDFLVAFSANPEIKNSSAPFRWVLISTGPDGWASSGEYLMFGLKAFYSLAPEANPPYWGPPAIYDATNGTISQGDVTVVGPGGGIY
jgi:type II secretion system protein G